MSQDELDLLSKKELIRLILKQAKQLAQLRVDYEALKQKLEQIQRKPPGRIKQPPFTTPLHGQKSIDVRWLLITQDYTGPIIRSVFVVDILSFFCSSVVMIHFTCAL